MFMQSERAPTGLQELPRGTIGPMPSRQRMFRRGTDLLTAGRNAEHVVMLLEGWAARYRSFADGRRQIMAVLVPGDLCELDVLWDGPLENSVCAITPVRVALIPRRQLREQMATDSELTLSLWCEVLASATVQQEWTVNLGRRSASERLGHLFCEIYMRMDAIGLAFKGSCDFPLTQADLGDTIGLTAVHINRTLQQLRATGLVSLNKRCLTIHDREALEEQSIFDPGYLHLSELTVARSAMRTCWGTP